jgi:hypothetical protein
MMKTPTLLVRMAGLYLLGSGAMALVQSHRMQAMRETMPGATDLQVSIITDLQAYAWIGIAIGLGAVLFAGPLARLLTFDSEPRRGVPDLSDQLLEGDSRKSPP